MNLRKMVQILEIGLENSFMQAHHTVGPCGLTFSHAFTGYQGEEIQK